MSPADEDKGELLLLYLWAHDDAFLLRHSVSYPHIPEMRILSEKYFHMLIDHLFVYDFPETGAPQDETDELKRGVITARTLYYKKKIDECIGELMGIDGTITRLIYDLCGIQYW